MSIDVSRLAPPPLPSPPPLLIFAFVLAAPRFTNAIDTLDRAKDMRGDKHSYENLLTRRLRGDPPPWNDSVESFPVKHYHSVKLRKHKPPL